MAVSTTFFIVIGLFFAWTDRPLVVIWATDGLVAVGI
jgi:hypothetical protein